MGSTFCNLEWVIRIGRHMQLLLLHFTGNRSFLNVHKGVQQAAKENKTEQASSLEAQNTMSIILEERR